MVWGLATSGLWQGGGTIDQPVDVLDDAGSAWPSCAEWGTAEGELLQAMSVAREVHGA